MNLMKYIGRIDLFTILSSYLHETLLSDWEHGNTHWFLADFVNTYTKPFSKAASASLFFCCFSQFGRQQQALNKNIELH